jgi:hypothetical protein
MGKENINIKELVTPITFAKEKGVSKQSIYKIIAKNKVDVIKIDGVMFIVLNEKTKKYRR